jgi:DNA invertase Pin-like site-specific DNA recombinase
MRSVADQHTDNEHTAQAESWVFGKPYLESGAVSASRYSSKARPGFDALVADVKAGRFGADVLMLWEPSRGSRRLSVWAAFLEALEDKGIALHITSHGKTYDLSNARDRRSLHEDGTDSEYESAKLSGRVSRSMAINAAEGRPHGRTPYGYLREYRLTSRGRELVGQVKDPETAPVVERIYSEITQGRSLRAIAAALNAEGIAAPAGGKWAAQNVRDLALNPAYAALRLHAPGSRGGHHRIADGTLTEGTWPPIVTREMWEHVRALLTDPSRRTSRPGRDKHLCSMIAVCDVCGGPLSVRYQRGAEYACRDSGHVRIPQSDLDGLVTRLAVARLASPAEYPQVTRDDDGPAVQAARDELAAATAHHNDMVALMAARKLSPLAFARAEPAALASIEAAKTRLRDLETPDALRMLAGDPGEDITTRWDSLPVAGRREVVRLLFARIAVTRSATPGHRPPASERTVVEWRSI